MTLYPHRLLRAVSAWDDRKGRIVPRGAHEKNLPFPPRLGPARPQRLRRPGGSTQHHPRHHHQHPGFRPAGPAHPHVPARDRHPGEDHRGRLRPGPGHGRKGRSGRASGSLPGRRKEIHGRRPRGPAPARHAQRLRHPRPAGGPGRGQGRQDRPRRLPEDRDPGPALVLPGRQLRHPRPGAEALEGRRSRPPGAEMVPADRPGHGPDAQRRGREEGLHPVRPGHLPGHEEGPRHGHPVRGGPHPAQHLPRHRTGPGPVSPGERPRAARPSPISWWPPPPRRRSAPSASTSTAARSFFQMPASKRNNLETNLERTP